MSLGVAVPEMKAITFVMGSATGAVIHRSAGSDKLAVVFFGESVEFNA